MDLTFEKYNFGEFTTKNITLPLRRFLSLDWLDWVGKEASKTVHDTSKV